jgi:outer membrane protein assembly factor BamB
MKTKYQIIRSLALGALAVFNLQPPTASAQNGSWATNLAAMSPPRAQCGAATIGGLVYLVGGGDCICSVTSTLQAYDPLANTWTNLAPMPTARYQVGAAELNGLLYAIGGNPGCGDIYQMLSAVEAYDPVSNLWSSRAPLPAGISQAGVVSAVGKIYVIGGAGCCAGNTVYCYDPATNGWSLKTPIPVQYCNGTAVAVNGIIYIIGGGCGSEASVYAYDPVADAWTARSPMPTARSACAGAVVNGIIYVAGGYGASGYLATVEAYNPATDTWSEVTPLPSPLNAGAAAAVNGTLYVLGGCCNLSLTGSVEALTPGTSIAAINMYAGLTICGPVGSTNEIDYCNDLAASNWTALATIVLSNSSCLYIDTNSTYFSHRFYRAVSQ